MKNTIKVFVLVALTLAAMSVSAQVKLGHIETQKLIQAMPEWTAAQKTFEEEQKKVNTELNGLREQFQTKLAEYSEKMKTYSEAMRATTEEELQGFYIVKSILHGIVDLNRVIYRDTISYFGILLDDNNRKPICRLHFNRSNKYLEVFDENKKGTKYLITSLEELYNYSKEIIESAKNYLND